MAVDDTDFDFLRFADGNNGNNGVEDLEQGVRNLAHVGGKIVFNANMPAIVTPRVDPATILMRGDQQPEEVQRRREEIAAKYATPQEWAPQSVAERRRQVLDEGPVYQAQLWKDRAQYWCSVCFFTWTAGASLCALLLLWVGTKQMHLVSGRLAVGVGLLLTLFAIFSMFLAVSGGVASMPELKLFRSGEDLKKKK